MSDATKQLWCRILKRIDDSKCMACHLKAAWHEEAQPLYQFCDSVCQEKFHVMFLQAGGKRRFNPDALPPPPGWKLLAEVQPDLLVKIIQIELPGWQYDDDQFRQLAELREVDDHLKELIDERLYKNAIQLPEGLETKLTNEALQRFPNLEYLYIEEHVMQDAFDLDLSHLSNLQELRIPNDHDHFILGELPKLRVLVLKVVDEAIIGLPLKRQLATYTQIVHLDINRSDIFQDDDLINFVNLVDLKMEETNITDSSLQQLTKLRTLFLKNNNVTNNSISKLINLERLEMVDQRIVEAGLLNLTNLRELVINNQTDVDDTILKQLTSLKKLSIWRVNNITGDGFLTLTKLKKLSLYANDNVQGEFVSQMVWLKKLNLQWNAVIDYRHIRPLVNLEEIIVDGRSLVKKDAIDILLELFISKRWAETLIINLRDGSDKIEDLEERLEEANEEIAKYLRQ